MQPEKIFESMGCELCDMGYEIGQSECMVWDGTRYDLGSHLSMSSETTRLSPASLEVVFGRPR